MHNRLRSPKLFRLFTQAERDSIWRVSQQELGSGSRRLGITCHHPPTPTEESVSYVFSEQGLPPQKNDDISGCYRRREFGMTGLKRSEGLAVVPSSLTNTLCWSSSNHIA